jgi:membrane-associated protease RseP (regulator of RpoE activity)
MRRMRLPFFAVGGRETESQIYHPIMRRHRTWVHVLLFSLTCASTFFVASGEGWIRALMYSGGLMLVLLSHEMGHYLTAKKNGVEATLPYFIPLPLPPFGTMGAVIKMGGRIPDRRALFDVGAAGPLAGLVVLVPVVVLGLKLSKVVDTASLGKDTALNLLPVGQLDGGHIVYALFRGKSRWVSAAFYGLFVMICLFFYFAWFFMAIILFLIRKHPPTLNDDLPLDGKRKALGVFVLLVFALSFTPVPFGFGEGLIPMLIKELHP